MFLFLQELIKIILLLKKIDQSQIPMNLPLVQFKNVTINQNKQTILSDVNIEVESGEFVFLIGKTGTGKSSLLKILYGDTPINSGTGNILGFDLNNLKDKEIPLLRRKLGVVFQDFKLLTDRSIYDNLTFELSTTFRVLVLGD